MPADTLLAISQRAAARGASRIYSVGDLPHHLVAPVLSKIPSPGQLHEIELSSPQLIGLNDELWLAFLRRDIPNYDTKPHRPANPASWFKVYKRLKREAEQEMKEGQDKLKAALGKIKNEKEEKLAKVVEKNEMPRHGGEGLARGTQIGYNYASGKIGVKGSHKMTLLEKIRKEKSDARAVRMSRPTSVGTKRPVGDAPRTMVEGIIEERRRLEEERKRDKSLIVRAPRPPMHGPASNGVGYNLMADREKRLKAMKNRLAVDRLSEPQSPHLPSQKEDGGQQGLTADSLEELFDDDLDSDGNLDEELLPTITRPQPKQRPQIVSKPIAKGPDKSPPADHRSLMGPSTSKHIQKQRCTSPGKIERPKPMLKRKAPPSMFHTPAKRAMTRL